MAFHPLPGFIGRRGFLAAGLTLLTPASGVLAQSTGKSLLTVTDPSGGVIAFDEASLGTLPWHEIMTHTRWTDGPQLFRGPYLKDVLIRSGRTRPEIEGRDLRMRALNEFEVTVPAGDAWAYDPILAREMNGERMRIRDKGPLWLIYPRDDDPALQNPLIDERWIWQLAEIMIL